MRRIASLSKCRKAREATTKAGYYCDLYISKRNNHKFIEVHYYHCGHQTLRQFIAVGSVFNYTGDGNLHRVNNATLKDIIDDYTLISSYHKHKEA